MNPMTAMIGTVIAKSTRGGPNTYATHSVGRRSSAEEVPHSAEAEIHDDDEDRSEEAEEGAPQRLGVD